MEEEKKGRKVLSRKRHSLKSLQAMESNHLHGCNTCGMQERSFWDCGSLINGWSQGEQRAVQLRLQGAWRRKNCGKIVGERGKKKKKRGPIWPAHLSAHVFCSSTTVFIVFLLNSISDNFLGWEDSVHSSVFVRSSKSQNGGHVIQQEIQSPVPREKQA